MYDIVFFTDSTDNISVMLPFGAYKCAHVLRKHGFSCLVINYLSNFSQTELKELIDIAIGKNTLLIGFSSSFMKSVEIEIDPNKPTPPFPNLANDLVFPQGKLFEDQILSYIRQKNTSIKVVAGGSRVSTHFSNRNVDYVCIGYSEISIVNLARHLKGLGSLEKSYKNIFGVVVIDDRTASEYDFSNEDMEWLPIDIVNHKTLPIEIGRGCIFKCKFCAFPLNGKKKLDFVKQADILKRELELNYYRYGITTYQIVDDTFNDHELKMQMIHDVVKSLSFKPRFWAYTRLDLLHLKPHTIGQLYDIGMRAFFFGIETTHQAAGKIVGKGYDFDKMNESIKFIRKTYQDVTMHGSFIIGLPHEDIDHVKSTFDRLCSQEIPLHTWRFGALNLQDQTSLSFESEFNLNYEKYGYTKIENIKKNRSLGWVRGTSTINWQNQYMDYETAVTLSNFIIEESAKKEEYKLQGTFTFPAANLGFDPTMLVNVAHRDFDYNQVETQLRPSFIKKYKTELIKLLCN